MNDTGVYLLLEAIFRQAIIDSKQPKFRCEHPPYYHDYSHCAIDFVSRIKRLSRLHDYASEVGLTIVEVIDRAAS